MQNEKLCHIEALNNVSELVFYLDADLNIEWANQAANKYFDADIENLKGQIFFEKCNNQVKSKCCPIIRAKETKEIEEGIMDNYNDRKWKIKAMPELNKEGKIENIIIIGLDITSKKELELKKQRDKLNWIIEGTNLGTWEFNIQTGETIYNEKWAEMLGYTLEELEPSTIETWNSLIHPDDAKKSDELFQRHINGEVDIYSCEKRLKHKEGHWVWVLGRGKITSWTDDGKPLKVFGINVDISEQKRHEKIIKELNKVAVAFQSLDNEEEICQKTIETAREILNFDMCNIALVEDNNFIEVASSEPIEFESLPLDYGILGKAFKNNESYLNSDIEQEPDAKPIRSTYKSGMTIPMQDIGVFQAVSNEKNDFSQKDLELAEILISNTKAALERVYYQEELKYKAFHDRLTDLYNRRFFEMEMQRLDVNRQLPLSIIMADVNGLKIINDSYGHEKGDELLVKTAEILKTVLKEEDILARQGGDEFAILLPNINNKQVNKIIKRIKNKVKMKNKDRDIPISLTMGSATKENPEQNIYNILQIADDNMYQNKLSESRSSKSDIVYSLLNTLSAKSSETKKHAIRMTKLAFNFGEKLNLSNSELNKLSLLTTLHDIGKTSISEEILNKPGDLNKEEWELMKKHPEQGYKIALASEQFDLIAEEILAHHEHWDGSGYPNGLKGEEIPFLARILSIIDAFDVMTSDRPYSKAISKEEAITEIKDCAGSQFAPELAEKFVEMMK